YSPAGRGAGASQRLAPRSDGRRYPPRDPPAPARARRKCRYRMSYATIRLETAANGVATLTLGRPDTLNALTPAMLDEIGAAVTAAPAAGARCLLITGAGRGFSSGA